MIFESNLKPISSNVPYGSNLRPFVFVMFINDIVKQSDKLNFTQYADDTTMSSTFDCQYLTLKADQLHSLKKSAFCLKTSYFMNK